MSMADARHVLRGCTKFDGCRQFGNKRASIWTNHMRAEQAVGCLVRQDLYKPVHVTHCPRTPIGREGKLANGIGYARSLKFFFGLSNRSDLRPSIDNARDRIVIHMSCL